MKLLIIAILSLISNLLSAAVFNTEQWQTSKGTPVVFYRAMEVPMLDISFAFRAGSAYDGAQFGLAALTNRLLNEGNAGLSSAVLAESLENTGAIFDTTINRDMAVLSLRTLTETKAMEEATTLFEKILSKPDFPQTAFEREKKQQAIDITQVQESPNDIANQVFFKALYKDHPYAHPVNGSLSQLKTIYRKDVLDFYQKHYVAKNGLIVLVGAIDSSSAHKIAERLTEHLHPGKEAAPIPPAAPLTEPIDIHVDYPSSQTSLRIGQLGINHHSPDYFPILVGNYVLGGNALHSILASEIRGKLGLTYSINSQFAPMSATGPFITALSTQTKGAEEALKRSQSLIENYIHEGPNAEELLSAKQYLIGNFGLTLSSNKNIANVLLRMHFYHLPSDFLDKYVDNIKAVTELSVKMAFQKYLNPKVFITVKVGK